MYLDNAQRAWVLVIIMICSESDPWLIRSRGVLLPANSNNPKSLSALSIYSAYLHSWETLCALGDSEKWKTLLRLSKKYEGPKRSYCHNRSMASVINRTTSQNLCIAHTRWMRQCSENGEGNMNNMTFNETVSLAWWGREVKLSLASVWKVIPDY